MNIAIGGDHASPALKKAIIEKFTKEGHVFKNFGTDDNSSVDYPDYGHPVAKAVLGSTADLGIVICGSGNGINMTVNKHAGIRSALCWNAELASLSRQHNDANILALPARFISEKVAFDIVDSFLKADFEGGRHQNRVAKINC